MPARNGPAGPDVPPVEPPAFPWRIDNGSARLGIRAGRCRLGVNDSRKDCGNVRPRMPDDQTGQSITRNSQDFCDHKNQFGFLKI
jgi:hypothetical protein